VRRFGIRNLGNVTEPRIKQMIMERVQKSFPRLTPGSNARDGAAGEAAETVGFKPFGFRGGENFRGHTVLASGQAIGADFGLTLNCQNVSLVGSSSKQVAKRGHNFFALGASLCYFNEDAAPGR
jgi:hypothetical protein